MNFDSDPNRDGDVMLSDSSTALPAVLEFKVVYLDAITGEHACFTTFGGSADEAIGNLCRSRSISDIVHVWDAALEPKEHVWY